MTEPATISGSTLSIEYLFGVRDKSVVITGGASGIGLAIARAYLENGAKVTILDVNGNAIDRALAALGPRARGYPVDVVDRGQLDAVFDRIDSLQGGIDIVFANAGIGGGPGFAPAGGMIDGSGAIDDPSDGDWEAVIAVNLMGVRNTMGAAARVMKRNGRGGRIVSTSSAAAVVHAAFVSTSYHASKAAVAHLTRHVALELAPHNILVNAMAPANFITNIGDGGMQDESVKALFASTSPLNRTAEAEEIGGLALFYGSAASAYITGTQTFIDGGSSVRRVG